MTDTRRYDVTATRDTEPAHDTGRAVVSLDTAAAIVGCSRRTLQRAIQRGELERIEVDGRAVIDRAALDAWTATRDTRHVAGMTSQRHATRDTVRHDTPTSDDRAGRIALLEAEVAALRERAAFAERVATERQRTIDALTGAVARLTAAIEAGPSSTPVPASLSPEPIEHAPAATPPIEVNTPQPPVTHLQARGATDPPSAMPETLKRLSLWDRLRGKR
jgi:excisionase family DNA binding protein